jgi:hypothetical protein
LTEEFLKWFLEQRPFRKSRLIMKNNIEYFIERPEYITFNLNNTICLGPDKGFGRQTINLDDIMEIRQ